KCEHRKRGTNEEIETGVLASVAINPRISSRQIERKSGISRRSVLHILHRHKFQPYIGSSDKRTMWYQHNSCPAHYLLIAQREVDEKFQNRWIGCSSAIYTYRFLSMGNIER
ncbi:hypothetical protein WN55_10678, partial [Dufourea novaeangliae]